MLKLANRLERDEAMDLSDVAARMYHLDTVDLLLSGGGAALTVHDNMDDLNSHDYWVVLSRYADVLVQVWDIIAPSWASLLASLGDKAIQYGAEYYELSSLVAAQELEVKAQNLLSEELIRETDLNNEQPPSVPDVPNEDYSSFRQSLGDDLVTVQARAAQQAGLDGPDVLVEFVSGMNYVDPNATDDPVGPYWNTSTDDAFQPHRTVFETAIKIQNALKATSYQTANGPRTYGELVAEMKAAGYNGPWDDVSLLAAYNKTAMQPTPTPQAMQTPTPQASATAIPTTRAAPAKAPTTTPPDDGCGPGYHLNPDLAKGPHPTGGPGYASFCVPN
jgi:hypothetical protein